MVFKSKQYMVNSRWRNTKAFTIVELLIIILVISILATLTIIGYSGISSKANSASIQSDLTNAAKQLKIFYADKGYYPTANNCPSPLATEICLKSSAGNSLSYVANSTLSPSSFSIVGSNGQLKYQVSESSAIDVIPELITSGLILNLDPASSYCYPSGQPICTNSVTGGLVTGANGAPGTGVHTPSPANFPAYNPIYGGVFDFADGKGMNVEEDLGSRTELTLSMWIYKNETGTPYFTDARNSGGQWFLSNYLSKNINYGDALGYNFEEPFKASTVNFINKWINIVVTSDNSGAKIYLNGKEVPSYAVRTSINETLGVNFRIGTRYTNSGQWTGYMGPVSAYSRVLSASEISQNFNVLRSRYGL